MYGGIHVMCYKPTKEGERGLLKSHDMANSEMPFFDTLEVGIDQYTGSKIFENIYFFG